MVIAEGYSDHDEIGESVLPTQGESLGPFQKSGQVDDLVELGENMYVVLPDI